MRTTLLMAALALAGCAHNEKVHSKRTASAEAMLEAKSGSSMAGQAMFLANDGAVTMQIEVSGATPGKHAVHLHVNGDCSSDDAESAGPHWNPTEEPHGHLGKGPAHMGDIGNIDVGSDGRGTLTFTTRDWSANTGRSSDVVGRAVVVHAAEDDFRSQPAGNAGGRVACGVVTAASGVSPAVSGRTP